MNLQTQPSYNQPASIPPEQHPLYRKQERFNLGRIGLALLTYLLVSDLVQFGAILTVSRFFPKLVNHQLFLQVISAVSTYGIGFIIAIGMLSGMEKRKPERQKLSVNKWFLFFALCLFGMYGGNMIGIWLMTLIEKLRGMQVTNAVSEMITANSPLYIIIFVVILAPIFEELLCRKLIIDRMLPYSEKLAVLMSAVFFGLLHRNFYQFFYAGLVGIILGYVYVKTGKILHAILLHILMNFAGTIVSVFLQDMLLEQNGNTMFWFVLSEIYSIAMLALAVCGCVYFFLHLKNHALADKGTRALSFKSQCALIWSAVGTILFITYCGLYFMMSLFY